jgi:hypothetical protein
MLASKLSSSARSRGVGVATEMLLTKAEEVSGDGYAPPGYARWSSVVVIWL